MQQQVLQNTFVPTHIVIGAEQKKQKKFDDNIALQKIGGHYKINAVTAYWDEKHIIGMQVYYKIGKSSIGDFLDAAHNKPEKKGKIHGSLFEIGPDDYILEINGKVSDGKLNKIGFVTYRGKQVSFGVDQGTFFSHKYDNYTFGGFLGGFRDYIEFLHIPLLPVPQDFLREFKPILLNVNMNNEHLAQAELRRVQTGNAAYGINGGNNQGSGKGGSIIQARQDFMQINIPQVPIKHKTDPVPQNFQQNNHQQYQQNPGFQYNYPIAPPNPLQNSPQLNNNHSQPQYGQNHQQNQYNYPVNENKNTNNYNFGNTNNNNAGIINSKYPVLKK